MVHTGNKGEWSELYAFLKLLADGKLYCGDGHLNRYDEKYYPILEIFRDDSVERNCYKVNAAKRAILISGRTTNVEIPQQTFREEAEHLFNFIRTLRGTSGNIEIERFMQQIGSNVIKAKSSDKADIRITIHHLDTGSSPELGYSIKSKAGAASTLINSNRDATNFVFRISGFPVSEINTFNAQKKFEQKFALLKQHRAKISFSSVVSKSLHSNLMMLDLGLERIIAEALCCYYGGGGCNIAEVTSYVEQIDPLGIKELSSQPMYAYKVKQWLLAFALGMTPSKLWNGRFYATGGYIVVKEDGDIVCYHFFDRNDLEDYLFYNTRFDTPSTSRHQFGQLYEKDGALYLKLNLQVRFKA